MKNVKSNIFVFLIGSLLIFLCATFYFDYYVQSSALAIVNSWLKTEFVSIQQGNILTSVAKLQRIINSSDILSSITVFDNQEPQKNLLTLGDSFSPLRSNEASYKPIVIREGISLSRQIIVNLTRQGLTIVFRIKPAFSNDLFISFTSSFLILFWLFMFLVFKIERSFSLTRERLLILSFQEKIDKLALLDKISAQVAHDIRSPLMALQIGIQKISNIPEEIKGLVNTSIVRITEMGNELLDSRRLIVSEISDQNDDPIEVKRLISDIIEEKKAIYNSRTKIKIVNDGCDPSVVIRANRLEIERILSNIIDNSCEAISSDGEVRVGVRCYSSRVAIFVIDNGIGISAEKISLLGKEPLSFGEKLNGKKSNGLGLYHANNYLKSIKGILSVQSSEGSGTIVQLIFSV